MPRNEAPDNTIMKDVPPGDETGVYYILLGGLPFGTIWQLLKDWLREAGCDVDHIEVFQKSTSGWIRLVGKDNFERALEHLRTTAYNNRLLLYLDKNRSESIKIMELIDDPPPRARGKPSVPPAKTSRNHKEKRRSNPADDSPVTDYREKHSEPKGRANDLHNTLGADPVGESTPGWHCGPTFAPAHPFYDQTLWSISSNIQQPWIIAYPGMDDTANRPSKPSPWTDSVTFPPEPSQTTPSIREDHFTVHLLSLKHTASPQEVEKWVRGSLGQWAAAMCSIDIPMDHRKGRIWGSGYIIFSSAKAAERAVSALNQRIFMNRAVYARLVGQANGGKVPSRTAKSSCRPATSLHQPADRLPTQPQRIPGNTTDARYSGPVIAHGTNYRPK